MVLRRNDFPTLNEAWEREAVKDLETQPYIGEPEDPGYYVCACCGRPAREGTVHVRCFRTGRCPHGLGKQSVCDTCGYQEDKLVPPIMKGDRSV